MGRAQLEELSKHGSYLSNPKGRSMWPMLRSKKDIIEIRKPDRQIGRSDVVMYTRGKNDQGVIHRVYQVHENDYIIFGDNCWWKEIIPKEKVAGLAVRFCRNGKWYDMHTSRGYRLYAWFWTNTLLIRRPILWMRDQGKSVVRKLKKMIGK